MSGLWLLLESAVMLSFVCCPIKFILLIYQASKNQDSSSSKRIAYRITRFLSLPLRFVAVCKSVRAATQSVYAGHRWWRIYKVCLLWSLPSRAEVNNPRIFTPNPPKFSVTRYIKWKEVNFLIVCYPLCSCDRASWAKREERIPTRCNNIDDLSSIVDVDYWQQSRHVSGIFMPIIRRKDHVLLLMECICW